MHVNQPNGFPCRCEDCETERRRDSRRNAMDDAPPPHELTWANIEREALHCPVLQRLWHLDAMSSPLTREQLMVWTLLWFSRNRREMLDSETERLMREPARQT
jgi:hypothetical protein